MLWKNGKIIATMALAAALAAACGTQAPVEGKAASKAVAQIDLYVMSKCPYGVEAEKMMAEVVEKLGDAVSLKIHFIGTVDGDKFDSLHGEEEVKGNLLQLCAGDLKPEKQLAFINCMNENWKTIPEGWEPCAGKVGLDAAAVKACADGEKGRQLLKASFASSDEAGAGGSPTIKIATAPGQDYTGPRTADGLTNFICGRPGVSGAVAACPKIEVNMIAITDPRCGKDCDLSPVLEKLKQDIRGLKPVVYTWGKDPQAEQITKEIDFRLLPLVLFDETLANSPDGAERLSRFLEPKGKYKMLMLGGAFDPTAEICDNGQDDTGDGAVDCDDPTCKEKLACRTETPKSLEVFIMSQCPYGVMGVGAMKEVLEAFGADVAFAIHYIGDEQDGELTSMHGPAEVEEDIRAICAAKYYAKNNKYLDYLWCRGEAARDADWKACATGGIDAKVIEKCSTTDEGKALLKADMQVAKTLGIGGSPTWIVNGRTMFNAIAAGDIQKPFCEKNPGLKGCDVKLKTIAEIRAEMAGGKGGAPPPPAGGSCGN